MAEEGGKTLMVWTNCDDCGDDAWMDDQVKKGELFPDAFYCKRCMAKREAERKR